jgi:hypothetical protein
MELGFAFPREGIKREEEACYAAGGSRARRGGRRGKGGHALLVSIGGRRQEGYCGGGLGLEWA